MAQRRAYANPTGDKAAANVDRERRWRRPMPREEVLTVTKKKPAKEQELPAGPTSPRKVTSK